MTGDRQIAVYFTGRKHAGENVADVLKRRAGGLPPTVLMCDALASHTSELDEGAEMLLARCMAHGRRKIVSVVGSFPDQCIHVLVELGQVYKVDAQAQEQKQTPAERLQLHQEQSQPVMDGLEQWIHWQFPERLVEPNSGLGKALTYLQRHWKGLTLFLRQEGAPLDNNLVNAGSGILHRIFSLASRRSAAPERSGLWEWVGSESSDESRNAPHPPLTRPLAADVDIALVRLTNKAMPPPRRSTSAHSQSIARRAAELKTLCIILGPPFI